MQVVILAGGKGTRLASRLNGRPKPLVDVCKTPLLERQLLQLASQGISEAIVLVNHEAGQIQTFLANRDFGLETIIINDGRPRGTAGAVLAALDRIQECFLVVYGDTLFDIDVARMVEVHREAEAKATLFLHPNDHPVDSDLVDVDEVGRILGFHPYPHPADAVLTNLVNGAFYVVERSLLDIYRQFQVPADFAKDLFPAALRDGHKLHGYRSFEYIKDLGTPSRLDKVERHLATGVVRRSRRSERQRAVFVDRDGTLNALRDYVRAPADLELLPNVADSVRRLNEAERRVVVITNQPVLARGECSFDDMRMIHAKLDTELGRRGAYLDALYLCPHHPDAGFRGEVKALKTDCDCRKPKPGLIERAITELNIDRTQSFLIGDSFRDIEAAGRAGVMPILVGQRDRDPCSVVYPHFTVQNFVEATDLILDWHPRVLGLLEPIAANVSAGDLVLIGGLAHSGKSVVALCLSTSLRLRGLAPELVFLGSCIRLAERLQHVFMERYRFNGAQTAISRWLRGEATEFDLPNDDRHFRERKPGREVALHFGSVLIIEDAPVLDPKFETRRTVHRIYVESDEDERRKLIISELMAEGSSGAEADAIYASHLKNEAQQMREHRLASDFTIQLDPVLLNKSMPS